MARAKELGLTVILSGQGADEILLGYRKFLGFYLQSLVRQGKMPSRGRAHFCSSRTVPVVLANEIRRCETIRAVSAPSRQHERRWGGRHPSSASA